MIYKLIIMEISGILLSFFLIISDAVAISIVTGIVSIITLIVQAIINRRVNHIAVKQEIIHKQIDGQQTMLLEATGAQKKAEGKLETKDELIEVLKQTDAIKTDDKKPIDVIGKKNEDKLL